MADMELECSCGTVAGAARRVSADSGTRLVCCCDDCQRFARHLERQNTVLDEFGGTDIFQMPVSDITITDGVEKIACTRLSAKGMYRWYASCCNTPIGNTLGPGGPYIGLIHSFVKNKADLTEQLGGIRAYVQTGYALSEVPKDVQGSALSVTLRSVLKLLSWKVRGLNKPSPFFTDSGQPLVNPRILN